MKLDGTNDPGGRTRLYLELHGSRVDRETLRSSLGWISGVRRCSGAARTLPYMLRAG